MVFSQFVEIGRVCVVNYGPLTGKLCVIVNVCDAQRAQVDGPYTETGVARQLVPFARLSLTDITIPIKLNCSQKNLKAAFVAGDVKNKFKATKAGKTLDMRTKRASMNDFDRFKVMVARKLKSKAIKKKMAELKK